MPVCGKCSQSFGAHHFIKGIRLTCVCQECVMSDDGLVNKTTAITMGARPQDLKNLDHQRELTTHLFLKQEVKHVADIALGEKREQEDIRERTMEARARVKKARQEDRERSLEKRTQHFLAKTKGTTATTALPTPGLVSGDFCTTSTKTPRMSVTRLCKRVTLWRTLDVSNISQKVNLYTFACDRRLYLRQRHEIESMLLDLHQSLDKVVLSEGNRVLTFLSPMERMHALRAMPCAERELYGLPVAQVSDDMYALCRYTKKSLDKMQADAPVSRKMIIGKTTAASWDEVLVMLNSRSGPVIPRRIQHYGVPRVFEMLCKESPRWKRKANVTECVAATGMIAPSFALMQTLKREYIGSESLADFQSIEHVVRIFHGRRMAGPNILHRFRLFRQRMEDLVYEGGQPWAEAAFESYHTFFFTCACGNTSAKSCALRMCRICCEKDTSVPCIRHKKFA